MTLPVNILTLSAPSAGELDSLIESYKVYLREEGGRLNLADVAYSASRSSAHLHPHRLAVVGKSCLDVANNLEKLRFERDVVVKDGNVPKICFLFSGNGSSFHRMGQTLYETMPHYKRELEKSADIMRRECPELSFHDALFGEDESLMENPVYDALTHEVTNYIVSNLWTHWGIKPDCVLGHSLGEYAAAPACGIHSPEDTLKICFSMFEAGGLWPPGRMAVVMADEKTLENLIAQCQALTKATPGSWISLAGTNSQVQHVVAGAPSTIANFLDLCKNNAVKAVQLPLRVAYHSQGVDPMVETVRASSDTLTYNPPNCAYISCLTGKVVDKIEKGYWPRHIREPFQFSEACRTAYDDCGARVFLEMGGQPIISALVMQNADELAWKEPINCLQSMRKGKDDLEVMLDSLAKLYVMGYPVNWTNFYQDFDVHQVSIPGGVVANGHHVVLAPLPENEMTEEAFWTSLNQAGCQESRCDVILRYVFQVMRRVLKSDEFDLDPSQEFRASGIDSLLAIQMKTHLQKVLGSQVVFGFNDLIECYTPQQLAQKLHQLIYTVANKNEEKEEVKRLVRADSVLWDHIKPSPTSQPVPLDQIKSVLVTGATGNLAPHLVAELAKRPQIEKIYCLVREGRDTSAQERLEKHLKAEGIWDKIPTTCQVIAVKGNIVDEFLGMEKGEYEKLADQVNAVINCAVTSNHLATYKEEDLKYGGVRAVNVIGVQRVLEFCALKRTKWVFHASTFLALWGKKDYHYYRMPEEWPIEFVNDLDKFPNFGYSISKIIADQLVHQATQRGIPCKAFRFVKIGGETETGRQKVMQNHFFLKFLHYIVGGVMPSIDVPLQIMPVDTCAQISLRVFFDERACPSDIYNVITPYAVNELDLVNMVEEFGPQLKILSQLSRIVEKFGEDGARQKWLEMSASGPLARVVKELDTTLGENWWENPSSAFKNENVMEFIRSQFGGEMRVVPYEEYVKCLVAHGEDSLIYHWIDFYTSEDSVFNLADKGEMPLQPSWNKNQTYFMRWGKIEMLYPNLRDMIEHPWETLRRDIHYTIDNAKDIFRNRYHKQ